MHGHSPPHCKNTQVLREAITAAAADDDDDEEEEEEGEEGGRLIL